MQEQILKRSIVLLFLVASISVAFLSPDFTSFSTYALESYYEQQTNFDEEEIPLSSYRWQTDELNVCVYKEGNVPNSYYVWTKIAVQSWRHALRDYNDSDMHDRSTWPITARYTGSEFSGDCNVKVYIYDSYKDFPGYPEQTGAYTAVEYNEKGIVTNAAVYLSPIVLHGVENIDIDLPSHAFRNSALHELGHIFGLGHMKSEIGYLMSPRFDFWEEKDVMPITTLELSTLRSIYGSDGWSE